VETLEVRKRMAETRRPDSMLSRIRKFGGF
jgi:hypothetical protein